MKRLCAFCIALPAAFLLATAAASATTPDEFGAILSSYQEVPTLSTTGAGRFHALVTPSGIAFRLNYSGLEGGTPTAAHIHLGARGTNGGVIAFLCGGPRPACPESGLVTGTITPADIIGPTGQGIAPGEYDEALRALRTGNVYANVHTPTYPGGEIRGQVFRGSFLLGLTTE
jgi:hypothetical protein